MEGAPSASIFVGNIPATCPLSWVMAAFVARGHRVLRGAVQSKGGGKGRSVVAYGIYTLATVREARAARALDGVVFQEWLERFPDHQRWPLRVR